MGPPLRASIPISYSFLHVNTQPSKGARSFRLRPSSEALLILPLLPRGQATCPYTACLSPSISPSGVAWPILDCARRTSTFLSCAFREQEDARLPSLPSEAARCASIEDHQAPSPSLFREQEDDQATLPILHLARVRT